MLETLREIMSDPAAGALAGNAVESINELVMDVPTGNDGDDSIHRPETVTLPHETAARAAPARQLAPQRVVPFTRTLVPGKTAGVDVTAVQRALRAAGYRKIRPSGYFGPLMVAQVRRFRHENGLGAGSVYDRGTHAKLLPFFDAYGALLMQRWLAAHSAAERRASVVATALFGVAHRDLIHYSQGPQRMDGVTKRLRPPQFPTQTDCSGFATWCYFVPRLPDPCGFDYVVLQPHYTGSLAQHGVEVSTAKPGDLIIYGRGWPYSHVTIAIDSERCVSHGSDPGPMVLPIRYRSDLAMIRSYLPR